MQSHLLGADFIGLTLSGDSLVSALTGVPAGRLADRFSVKCMTVVEFAGIGAGALILSVLPEGPGVFGHVAPAVVMTSAYELFQAADYAAILTGRGRERDRRAGPGRRGPLPGRLRIIARGDRVRAAHFPPKESLREGPAAQRGRRRPLSDRVGSSGGAPPLPSGRRESRVSLPAAFSRPHLHSLLSPSDHSSAVPDSPDWHGSRPLSLLSPQNVGLRYVTRPGRGRALYVFASVARGPGNRAGRINLKRGPFYAHFADDQGRLPARGSLPAARAARTRSEIG